MGLTDGVVRGKIGIDVGLRSAREDSNSIGGGGGGGKQGDGSEVNHF